MLYSPPLMRDSATAVAAAALLSSEEEKEEEEDESQRLWRGKQSCLNVIKIFKVV